MAVGVWSARKHLGLLGPAAKSSLGRRPGQYAAQFLTPALLIGRHVGYGAGEGMRVWPCGLLGMSIPCTAPVAQ